MLLMLAIPTGASVWRTLSADPPLPIIRGDSWRYLKGTGAPPAGWNTVGFADSGWLVGPSGVGYGDGDDATVLSDMQNSYSSVYTRHLFDVPDPGTLGGLELKVDYDDGFVAYINGTEVARRNIPAGTPAFNTLASSSHEASGGTNGNPPVTINLGAYVGLLVPGSNVLAVQGLNVSLGSSDLTLIVELRVTNAPPAAPTGPTPVDGSAGVSLNPTLCVGVDDPDGGNLTTTFFGREVTGAPADDFTIIVLPDTQYYSASFPATYTAQTQWIVDNRVARNIVYVTGVGDCVDNATINQQLVNADAAWDIVEANPFAGQPFGLPFGIAVGNHDQAPNGDPGTLADEGATTSGFNTWFGVPRFAGRAYYGGHYGTNNDNHYDLFSASGMDFIAVHIEYMASDSPLRQAVIAWADGVLKTYPGRRAIVISHYLLETGTSTAFGNQGQAIYDGLKANPNLFLMLAGHLDQASRRTDVYNGTTVYTLKSDFQTRPNGGNGWLRIMTFSPANGSIHVETYSPSLGQFINTHADNVAGTAQNDFVLPYAMAGGTPFATLGTATASAGTTACLPWAGRQPGKQYEWYVTVSDGTDTTTGERSTFTTALTCFVDSDCADGNLCNGVETCVGGTCQPGTPPDCSDADACTTDTCAPSTGCVHTAVSCDDNDACTTDTCDSLSGCAHLAVTCPAGQACNGATGLCQEPATTCSTSAECGDADPCTTDMCVDANIAALSFDGTDDYVTMGAAPGLDSATFTIETWFKRTGAGVSNTTGSNGISSLVPLVTKGAPEADGSNVDANYILGVSTVTATSVLAADFEDTATGGNHPISGSTPIVNNVWYHAAATYDGTTWRLYLNGNLEATLVVGAFTPRSDSIQHAGLGAMLTSTGTRLGAFQGLLDEARIWNYARSQAEIQATMDSAVSSATGLLGRYSLDENAGTTAGDTALPAQNGTLTNGPTWNASDRAPIVGTCAHPAIPGCHLCNGDEECHDTNICNGTETCSGGTCQPGTALNCDDADACTVDSCDQVDGCQHAIVSCDDGVACTIDSCAPALGCTHTSTCTGGQMCNPANGLCEARCATAAQCDDADVCTTDTCVGGNAYALTFNGTNQYVSMGAAPNLDSATFTIETWFKRTGTGTTTSTGGGGIAALVPLVAKGAAEQEGSNVDANYLLGINTATNVLAADFEEGPGGSGPLGQNHPVSGVTPVTNNVWHHAAATYDGSTWRLYLDGALDQTLAVNQPVRSDSIQHFGLGTTLNSSGTASGFFAGELDEVRVWNRALTQAEIQSNMNLAVTSGSGLIGRWGFEDGATVTDSTTPAENGTPFNAPVFDANDKPLVHSGVCGHAPISCDDANLCTTDTCNAASGCVHTPLLCSDGDACNGIESCNPGTGQCVGGTPTNCDDGNTCTGDTCAAAPAPAALSFDGTDDYVTMGAAPNLGSATFTIETWFKRTGAGVSNTTGGGGITVVPLVTKGAPEAEGSNVDANYILGINTTGNVLAADFEDTAAGTNHPVSGTTPIVNNVWYHAAATYDGTTWRLYLNGSLEATLAVGVFTPRFDSIQHAGLGAMMTSTGTRLGAFQGLLDEARIWNYARSQVEIQAGKDLRIASRPGLLGRWGLDDGVGGTALDSTTSAENGTLTNFNLATAWSTDVPSLSAAVCTSTAQPNGTTCSDGNACTTPDQCSNGLCTATYAPTPQCCTTAGQCNDGNAATADACVGGDCTNTLPVSCSSAAQCDDGNVCTSDTCVGGNVSALKFDGTNDYVTMGAAAGETALGARAFTLETWVRRDGASWGVTTSTGNGGISAAVPLVTKGRGEAENSNVDCNYFLGITSTGRPVADFEQFADGGGWLAGQNHPACSSASITDQNWHHVAVTFSTTTGWHFYVDGVEGTTADGTACTTCSPAGSCPQNPGVEPRYDSIQHFGLGTAMTSTGAAAGFYSGLMDEARVWNRALSQSEIQAGMNLEVSSGTGLIGRWGLNENTATIAGDSTSPAQNGTLTNGPTWSPADKPSLMAGLCQHTPGNAGTTCRAAAGACDATELCTGSSPLCPADQKQPNGTSCSDGDACTQTDTCQAGVCTGGNAVTCTASDQCHTAGTCNPATGACSNPAQPDGFACNDNDACTQTDTCQAGLCTSGSPVVCTASDQCHVAGTCNPATGVCSNPAQPDGTTCEDGSGCTVGDACQAGSCAPGVPIGAPGEVTNVQFDLDGITLTWDPIVSAPAGTGFDVARGLAGHGPVGNGAGEACMESGTAFTQFTDTANPDIGEAWWYLVRGRHVCGTGTYGYAAENGTPTTERITTACP